MINAAAKKVHEDLLKLVKKHDFSVKFKNMHQLDCQDFDSNLN